MINITKDRQKVYELSRKNTNNFIKKLDTSRDKYAKKQLKIRKDLEECNYNICIEHIYSYINYALIDYSEDFKMLIELLAGKSFFIMNGYEYYYNIVNSYILHKNKSKELLDFVKIFYSDIFIKKDFNYTGDLPNYEKFKSSINQNYSLYYTEDFLKRNFLTNIEDKNYQATAMKLGGLVQDREFFEYSLSLLDKDFDIINIYLEYCLLKIGAIFQKDFYYSLDTVELIITHYLWRYGEKFIDRELSNIIYARHNSSGYIYKYKNRNYVSNIIMSDTITYFQNKKEIYDNIFYVKDIFSLEKDIFKKFQDYFSKDESQDFIYEYLDTEKLTIFLKTLKKAIKSSLEYIKYALALNVILRVEVEGRRDLAYIIQEDCYDKSIIEKIRASVDVFLEATNFKNIYRDLKDQKKVEYDLNFKELEKIYLNRRKIFDIPDDIVKNTLSYFESTRGKIYSSKVANTYVDSVLFDILDTDKKMVFLDIEDLLKGCVVDSYYPNRNTDFKDYNSYIYKDEDSPEEDDVKYFLISLKKFIKGVSSLHEKNISSILYSIEESSKKILKNFKKFD